MDVLTALYPTRQGIAFLPGGRGLGIQVPFSKCALISTSATACHSFPSSRLSASLIERGTDSESPECAHATYLPSVPSSSSSGSSELVTSSSEFSAAELGSAGAGSEAGEDSGLGVG